MKTNKISVSLGVVLCAVAGLAYSAMAQDGKDAKVVAKPAEMKIPEAPKPLAPITWSDPQFAKIATMLTGTWKTSSPVAQTGKSDKADVFLGVAPVRVNGMGDVLYFETARVDSMFAPFRQGLWQIYKNKGETRLRTFEFRRAKGEMGSAISMWAAPDAFPSDFSMGDLIGTLDLKLTMTGDSLTGKTNYPYPTGMGGAVEMTSEMMVTKDSLSTMDRGYGADGKVVWGPGEGQKYTFSRIEAPVDVKISEDGLVVIDYRAATTGEVVTNGWRVALQYTGSLANGDVVDSTKNRGKPQVVRIGDPMLVGLARGLEGIKQGSRRRLVIPSALGFGEAGVPKFKIPGNATLYYDIETLTTEAPAAPSPDGAPDAAQIKADANLTPTTKGNPNIQEIKAPPFKVDPKMLEPKKVPETNPPK